LSVVMSLRELAIRVLLISIVRFSTTSIIRPQRLYIVRVSPESARSLEHIPDKWRTVHLKFKAPQIEIQLMKGYVSSDENWMFATEYKYSGKDYKYVCKHINDVHPNVVNAIIISLIRIILHDRKSISGATRMTSTTNEKKIPRIENGDMEAEEKEKENNIQDNIVMPDRFIPQIESRNIITIPTYCPEGQRKDSRGRCRIVIDKIKEFKNNIFVGIVSSLNRFYDKRVIYYILFLPSPLTYIQNAIEIKILVAALAVDSGHVIVYRQSVPLCGRSANTDGVPFAIVQLGLRSVSDSDSSVA
ncbi:hypothetical protein ALC60_14362, partial [Trachymyrmex zeteki]